ncbi:MAG TPA: glycosyltransferase [Thermoanaerobaculia bacterium]
MPFLSAGLALLFGAIAIVGAYAVWLATARRRATPSSTSRTTTSVVIVVPVFDEAPLIDGKLANLDALANKQRVLIVDGGSTDGTIDRVRAHGKFELLETTLRNKSAQLREALRVTSEEWILVTDADALLEPDTLTKLLAVIDDSTGVVGASVRPVSAHALESLHWRATDWLRDRESDRGSAAIVAAPCYLAHRTFLELPHDTIADDVHVACRAMLAGLRVGHADARVVELRSPRTLRALLRHKYRKADAYLREIVRFVPLTPRMPRAQRAIFLWRAALLTLVPILGMLATVALAISFAFEFTLAMQLGSVAMLVVIALASRGAMLAAVLAGVSAVALLTYPFSRQEASFPKILQPIEYE